MASFCEGCPLRGDCTEPIDRVEYVDIETYEVIAKYGFIPLIRRPVFITLQQCVDVEGNRSRMFKDVSPQDPTGFLPQIDDCSGPEEDTVRRPWPLSKREKTIRKCGALGIAPNAEAQEYYYNKIRRRMERGR